MMYVIGVGLAIAVCLFALFAGFDRSRAFYPTLVLVVAQYYILFAVLSGERSALGVESLAAIAFLVLAIVGFKKSPWWAVVGLVGHGVFDSFHHMVIQNPGVPRWWPGFCLSFDIVAGGFLAALLIRRSMMDRKG